MATQDKPTWDSVGWPLKACPYCGEARHRGCEHTVYIMTDHVEDGDASDGWCHPDLSCYGDAIFDALMGEYFNEGLPTPETHGGFAVVDPEYVERDESDGRCEACLISGRERQLMAADPERFIRAVIAEEVEYTRKRRAESEEAEQFFRTCPVGASCSKYSPNDSILAKRKLGVRQIGEGRYVLPAGKHIGRLVKRLNLNRRDAAAAVDLMQALADASPDPSFVAMLQSLAA